jgi:hypothetical protein
VSMYANGLPVIFDGSAEAPTMAMLRGCSRAAMRDVDVIPSDPCRARAARGRACGIGWLLAKPVRRAAMFDAHGNKLRPGEVVVMLSSSVLKGEQLSG